MKLKQRILVFGTIITLFLLFMTCTIYYYAQNYHSGIMFTPIEQDAILSKMSRMRVKLAKIDKLRPNGQTQKINGWTFRKSLATPSTQNSSMYYYNSDKAAEKEYNETEYEEVLVKRDVFLRILGKNEKYFGTKGVIIEFSTPTPECSDAVMNQTSGQSREKFPDLLQFLEDRNLVDSNLKKERITLQDIHGIENMGNLSSLDLFHISISDLDLYAQDDPNVETLLSDMATQTIVHVDEKEGGTQLKLIITFQDGSQALFKPMRFDRDKETLPNHFYFVDYERHISEIATFHLDRILGFRRCPPVVGRKLNITSEIYAVAEDDLIKTFFISPAQNICFHGTCSYYCDTSHAICGRPDTIEGSLAAFLPPDTLSGRKSWKNPWKRSYHKRRKAEFERNPRYCEVVRKKKLFANSKRLADLVDTSILDFLIGNMDRHHYETFKIFGNDSFIIHLDHGRGFGRPGHDEISILAPLHQCCFVRFTTFDVLTRLQHDTIPLSSRMRCSLSRDPLSPILLEKHLAALDRRLEAILKIIKNCLQNHGSKKVFYRDASDWAPV